MENWTKMRPDELGGLFPLGAYLLVSTRLAKAAFHCAGLELQLVEASFVYCHITYTSLLDVPYIC